MVFSLSGPKHRQRFLCELSVPPYTYVGVGNSTTKKDAEKNAARDFISFLVRTNVIRGDQVPTDVSDGSGSAHPSATPMRNQQQTTRVFTVITFCFFLN